MIKAQISKYTNQFGRDLRKESKSSCSRFRCGSSLPSPQPLSSRDSGQKQFKTGFDVPRCNSFSLGIHALYRYVVVLSHTFLTVQKSERWGGKLFINKLFARTCFHPWSLVAGPHRRHTSKTNKWNTLANLLQWIPRRHQRLCCAPTDVHELFSIVTQEHTSARWSGVNFFVRLTNPVHGHDNVLFPLRQKHLQPT